MVLKNLVENGFKGGVYPINPNGGRVLGLDCIGTVLDVPEDVDLVNISIRAELVPGVIEECGQRGVKFAIVHSAGFRETGDEGIRLEREIVKLAHLHGMRVIGPNSQGIQNSDPDVSVYANFTFTPMKSGNVSVIAQGGGMGEMLNLHLFEAGIGFRMYSSYGNESDLTMPEILEYFGRDDGTRVIMMQTESFKDPGAFLDVASTISPDKPILALKGGRTSQGALAVSSHTGTLVDQAAMTTAMYRKAGVVEFLDTSRMIHAAVALSTQRPPPGKKIGIITNTGSPAIHAIDEAVDNGLEPADWSDEGRTRLKASLYPQASTGNPVDVIATAGPDHYFAALDTLLKEDGVDMALVFFVTAPFVDTSAIGERIVEACKGSSKPVVMVVETISGWRGLVKKLREDGLPVYKFPEDGVRALADMVRYSELRDREQGPPPDLDVDREATGGIIERYKGRGGYLSQMEAFAVLRAYGIRTPKMAIVRQEDDIHDASTSTGFPCVLKVELADVVHKSGEGGVVTDIHDEMALLDAFAGMRKRFEGRGAAFVIMAQEQPGIEVIVGARSQPGLGRLVMFGLGGVFVESIRDTVTALAPLSRGEARETMRLIRGHPALEGGLGGNPVDLDAVEELLVRVSRLAADFPVIEEMDVNPAIASPGGTVAVDVRIKVDHRLGILPMKSES